MSIYICIDKLQEVISFASTAILNSKKSTDLNYLTQLLNNLKELEKEQSNIDFQPIIAEIEAHLEDDPESTYSNTLNFLLKNLKILQRQLPYTKLKQAIYKDNNPLRQFQSDKFRILDINQNLDLISDGHCYGYVIAMADRSISPLYTPMLYTSERKFKVNETIYNYQKNYANRELDQGNVKRRRLIRQYYCPDITKQAENIFEFAKKNPNKELHLSLKGLDGGHACYVSWNMRNNGMIFMDPNYGGYFFRNKSDFLLFYRSSTGQSNYHLYQFGELIWDKNKKMPEKRTLAGKFRSLLTGSKYYEKDEQNSENTVQINLAIGGVIFSILAMVIVINILPILGITALSLAITSAAVLVATAGGIYLGAYLAKKATEKNFFGLLAIPHLISYYWHNFKEKHFASNNKLDNTGHSIETPKNDSNSHTPMCSTSKILGSINGENETASHMTGESDNEVPNETDVITKSQTEEINGTYKDTLCAAEQEENLEQNANYNKQGL